MLDSIALMYGPVWTAIIVSGIILFLSVFVACVASAITGGFFDQDGRFGETDGLRDEAGD